MPSVDSSRKRLIVHQLPAAPKFIGRKAEQNDLQDFWQGEDSIVSLIGLGGAGKTALASQFLTWVEQNDPPDALLVWSFYDDPDANAFLETLYRFLTGDEQLEVKGSGWFHLLREQLSGNRRVLLVLDGLERVQRPSTDASGIYGELEDPLLKGLLVRLAGSKGRAKAVVTSRFPVATIEPFIGKGYRVVDVEQLPRGAAQELLASRQINLDEPQLTSFLARFGSHALTLDLLAGAVSEFFECKIEALPPSTSGSDAAERLSFVLGLYETNLPQKDRDLLSRLCVFRFGVDAQTLSRIFVQGGNQQISGSLGDLSPEELDASIDRLVERHLLYRETNQRFTVHPAVRDHFYRLFRDSTAVHNAIAKHYSSLTERPGIGFPTDKESFDLLEELIHHALQANQVDEACEIYFSRLGGNDHLNSSVGEYARTYRILSAFPDCPDPSAMYHCERAFGNLHQALEWRPQNQYILLLEGTLSELAKESSEPTRMIALSLQGRDVPIPERSPDFPICSAMAYFYRGDSDSARRIAEREIALSLYQDDKVRNQIALAEVFRHLGQLPVAKEMVETASAWILQSASQEHLAALHLARANIAIDELQVSVAELAIAEGLAICQEAHFYLFESLFHLGAARLKYVNDQFDESLAHVTSALSLAQEMRFDFVIRAATKLKMETQHRLGIN